MTHKLLIVLLPLLLFAWSPGDVFAEGEFKVMSFNILRIKHSKDTCPWENRKDAVKAVITQENPDIVGFQEADMKFSEIEAMFPEYQYIYENSLDGTKSNQANILFKKDRFELIEYDYRQAHENYRGTYAVLKDKVTGEIINIHDIHQSCCSGQSARDGDMKNIIEQWINIKQKRPTIVLGDFNEFLNDNAIQTLLGNRPEVATPAVQFYETHNAVNDPNGPFYAGGLDSCTTDNIENPRPVIGQPGRIDFIFASDDITTLAVKYIDTAPGGVYPSDHIPVIATLVVGSVPIVSPTTITPTSSVSQSPTQIPTSVQPPVPSISISYTPAPTSTDLVGVGYQNTTCDLCGKCGGEDAPSDYEDCRACIYVDESGNPSQIPREGLSWTVLGCINTNPGIFTQQILSFIFTISGGVLFVTLLYGGFLLLTSEGDQQKVARGKMLVTSSILALVLILFSVFIIQFVGSDLLKMPGFDS